MAGVAAQEPQQDAKGGGLPGAVGAEEAVHLTGPYVQIETVEGGNVAEPLGEAVDEHGEL
ncbi:hypothetical protein GCM10009555_089810 [Acrocarpospora macrocephala]|uniref:Uncharacterized protein n=1 Tax=Acrocarpospora macrocephala TaxID=150177 RepID=A0A5M3WII7_9ACTN|nr:hypothetical protein Amac_025530 [Acrocarpospora macrocephala]